MFVCTCFYNSHAVYSCLPSHLNIQKAKFLLYNRIIMYNVEELCCQWSVYLQFYIHSSIGESPKSNIFTEDSSIEECI